MSAWISCSALRLLVSTRRGKVARRALSIYQGARSTGPVDLSTGLLEQVEKRYKPTEVEGLMHAVADRLPGNVEQQ